MNKKSVKLIEKKTNQVSVPKKSFKKHTPK